MEEVWCSLDIFTLYEARLVADSTKIVSPEFRLFVVSIKRL